MTIDLEFDNGWQEAVIVVNDLDRVAEDLAVVGKWQSINRGNIDPAQIKLWNLPDSVTGEYNLVSNPDSIKGFIRFVKLENIEQKQIRPAGQIWESGGIFDLNFRVTDINLKFEQFLNRGWTAFNEPVEYSFGPVTVSEVLMVGPDGIVIALIERITPPLEEKGDPDEIGRTFNSSLIVHDFEKTKIFFDDLLGFKPSLEVLNHNLPEGPNVLGLPQNITVNHVMNVYIYQQNGVADGCIEFLHLENLKGRNFSKRAKPHNFGITSLRFPVTQVRQKAKELKNKSAIMLFEPTKIDLPPYGKVEIFAIELPEGGWIEFFEPIN